METVAYGTQWHVFIHKIMSRTDKGDNSEAHKAEYRPEGPKKTNVSQNKKK